MSLSFADWALDTFLFTGLLIGFVLLIRRPIARYFGPTIAYALWALPLLRFFMPPLVLPASMAPEKAVPVEMAEPLLFEISTFAPGSGGAIETSASTSAMVDWGLLALMVWLIGAVIFLAMRSSNYRQMRRDLLAQARPVGEAGKVRLVETPAVGSPVAFGVFDKVIALPLGFMAQHDRAARDLAIAHELAHHGGHDLLANILAQPILALHWFNPLAWWGWRAMRADQEAACDARVIAGKDKSERATYAQVIAGFAAGDDLGLAASMACPVLGEKSIIHRLRSLTMSDISTTRRRLGFAALAGTALALPLTASVSYAHPHRAPATMANPPAPPAPPALPRAPEAPLLAAAPHAPSAQNIEREVHLSIIRDGEEAEHRAIALSAAREASAHAQSAMREAMARANGAREEAMAARQVAMAHANEARERAFVLAERWNPSNLNVECGENGELVEREFDDGRRAMVICHRQINAQALSGIRAAREALESNTDIPRETLEEVLRNLDMQIERLEGARQISLRLGNDSDRAEGEPSARRVEVRMVSSPVVQAPRSQPADPANKTVRVRLRTI